MSDWYRARKKKKVGNLLSVVITPFTCTNPTSITHPFTLLHPSFCTNPTSRTILLSSIPNSTHPAHIDIHPTRSSHPPTSISHPSPIHPVFWAMQEKQKKKNWQWVFF